MSLRNLVELCILEGYTNEQIAKASGYKLTPERVEEMREEMDTSARGLAYEGQD